MIFSRPQVRQILSGRKTQLRRPGGWPSHLYGVGKSVPVRVSTQPAAARIKVVAVGRGKLADVSPSDAWAEGFKTRDEFFDWWRGRYGTGPLMDVDVVVVEFVLAREEPPRMLHRHSERGYTSDPGEAVRGEPEAVDRATQERLTAEANGTDLRRARVTAQERRDKWELWERLRRLEALEHVDLSADLRVIARRIDKLERREAA